MAIAQAMCTSFKKELLEAKHNFLNSGGDDFKLALYTNAASIGAGTTGYTTSNEVSSSGTNYPAKGSSLTRVDPSATGTTGITSFGVCTFSTVTLTCRGALIYNEDTTGDTSVCVLDFGGDKTATSGDFTITFPAVDATNAIIRIA